MHFINTLASLAFAAGVMAQSGGGYGYGASTGAAAAAASSPSAAGSSSPSSSTMSPSSGGVSVHVVKVSNKNKDLVFSPADIKAKSGDMVQFQFYPMNHSIVQSTFDQPCEPIANNMPGAKGFFSGFMPVKATSTQMPAYSIAINDTKPIWFYCSQGKHCQAGMVGVINAPASNSSRTLDSFKVLAKKATKNVSPEVVEGGVSSASNSSSSAGSSASNSVPSSPPSSAGVPPAAATTAPLIANDASRGVFKGRFAAILAGFLVALDIVVLI